MKKRLRLSLLLLATLGWLLACHKDPDPPLSPEAQLPAATQEGRMTFGCLIDGQPWTPKAGIIPPPISVSYNELTGQGGIEAIRNTGMTGLFQKVSLGFSTKDIGVLSLPEGDKILIDTSSVCFDPLFNTVNGVGMNWYITLIEGKLEITHLNIQTGVIAGKFYFDAQNSECGDTIKITHGRFDIKYK